MNAITYIFLATLFYTAQPEVKENLYSWQLTFNSYEKCEQFYDRYGANLLNGVLDHGTKKYGKSLDVEYLSTINRQYFTPFIPMSDPYPISI